MSKKAVSLAQLEEALRDMARWIREKLSGYVAEPAAEGPSGWVLTTNGDGGRSWEAPRTGDPDNRDIWRPTVSVNGDITWERSFSLEAPEPMNIRGPKGDTGPRGPGALTNLLDNSDFTNPVNQRGVSESTYYGYFIDRWIGAYLNDGPVSITVDPEGLIFNNSQSYIAQRFNKGVFDSNKSYTWVLYYADGTVSTGRANIQFQTSYDTFNIHSVITVGKALAHIALYEGTLETAPVYVPKGYAAEVSACSQYNSITGEYKGAYSMDLLWENASPTSSFADQTIPVDLSSYDLCMVIAKVAASVSYHISCTAPVGGGGFLSYGWGDSQKIGHRPFVMPGGAIRFYDCSYDGGVSNGNIIPVKIYGIRGVG